MKNDVDRKNLALEIMLLTKEFDDTEEKLKEVIQKAVELIKKYESQ